LDSKKGTVVDEKRIQGEYRLEKGDEHVIQLAKYQHALRWVSPLMIGLNPS
jgi:hypothetical protein